jgi:TPR repeat protein
MIPKAQSSGIKKLWNKDYPSAQCNLGVCYEKGQGVTRDQKEAVLWYRKAADQGFANAQLKLGFCYEKGQGVTQGPEGSSLMVS